MRRSFAAIAIYIGMTATPLAAQAISEHSCELHIWPTKNVNAIDKTNALDSTGTIVSAFRADIPIQERIAQIATAEFQRQALESSGLLNHPAFTERTIIWHDEPSPERNWSDKKAMAMWGRHASSASPCYAELHAGWFTLLDQPLKDVLQNGWMVRDFGASELPASWAFEGGYTNASSFDWDTEEAAVSSRDSLKSLIGENFRKFLSRRKVKKVLAGMVVES